MATHSSTLAWRILWTEEPGGLPSMGLHRVGHGWSDFACMHVLGKEMAIHSSTLAWRIPGTGEPGGLPSMGSHRVGHDWRDLAAAAAYKVDGFLSSACGKESSCQCRRHETLGFDPWVRKIPCRRKWQPTPVKKTVFLMENPMERGAWRATVHGVAKSWTRLSTHDVRGREVAFIE